MLRREVPDMRVRLLTGAALLGLLIFIGTGGYMLIEGWPFLDALFMTVTTVTTVGYREVQPLGDAGRIFTIVLVLFGVGTAFYLLTTFVALVIEGDLGAAFGVTRMKGRIEQLRDHHILCGYGRVGEEIAREFIERNIPFVVVENNREALDRAIAAGMLVIEGDAADDEVLLAAGVEHARALLAASDSDSGNTYITLTAKALKPGLLVIARAGKRESEPRVRRAGADRVISPYAISGRRMALSAIQPNIVDFVDTLAVGRNADQIMAEIEVTEASGFAGATIHDVFHSASVTVLGVQHANGEISVGPRQDARLVAGDRLMVVGPEHELAQASAPPAHTNP
jgi:voltage-gated potassium channel